MESPSKSDSASGETLVSRRMTLLPLHLPEAMTVTSILTHVMPWQAPAIMGTLGTNKDGDGAAMCVISFEWPIQQLSLTSPLSKIEMEELHLNRFITDFSLLTQSMPFSEVEQSTAGKDPPDFRVLTANGQEGLDVASVTLPSRRPLHASFRVIRDALLRQPRERYMHLLGHVIYMWFGQEGSPQLPPRPSNDSEIKEIIEALANYQIDPDAFLYYPETSDEALPETFSNAKFESTSTATFYAMPMQGAVPASIFYLSTGFEIGMAYSTSDPLSIATNEMTRLIQSHDNEMTQTLILTIGAPDRNGFIYPSEHYVSEQSLSEEIPLPIIRHIRVVLIHFWQSGRIVQLYPILVDLGTLFPGQFSVPFFSASLNPTDPSGSSFQFMAVHPNDE